MFSNTIKKEFNELLFFLFPIALIIFFNQLFLFAEKIFLARLSTQMMEAAVSVGYLAQIFQGALVAMAMMAQVSVGRKHAAGQYEEIGPVIWQWIWFACLSIIISVPGNLVYGYFYLTGTEIETIAWPYFYLIISINFLYPLGAVLSCFFLGQRKRRLVFYASIGSHILKLGLSYVLIFGVEGWIPSFGLLGGALSALVAQGLLCSLLLLVFLNPSNANIYNTHDWSFRFSLFYHSIKPGLLRTCNRILTFTSWLATTHLMTVKGGSYLLILSIGGTVSLFFQFIGESLCQAQTLLVSRIIGTNENHRLQPALIAGFLVAFIATLIMVIPFVFFPQTLFSWLFPEIVLSDPSIYKTFWGVWTCSTLSTLSFVVVAFVLAFHDMQFSVTMGALSWINGFAWMYVLLSIIGIEADLFWLLLSAVHLVNGAAYLWRTKFLLNKESQLAVSQV